MEMEFLSLPLFSFRQVRRHPNVYTLLIAVQQDLLMMER